MTVLTFPSNPIIGQQYSAPNGIQYVFDGVKWIVETTSSSSEAVSNSTQDRVAPMFVDGPHEGITFTYNETTNTMTAEVTAVNGDRLINGANELVLDASGLLNVPGDVILNGGIVGSVNPGIGVGMWGDDPTPTTPGGSIYLQGGMSSAETGGPTTRGGNVIISAGQGANDVDAALGGGVEIYSGAASTTAGNIRIEGGGTYGSNGQGGNILIQSGSSISGVAGDISIQSGAGSGGGGLFEGSLTLRGATVDITSSSDSIKIKTGGVDFEDPNSPFVWDFNNLGTLTLPQPANLTFNDPSIKFGGATSVATNNYGVGVPGPAAGVVYNATNIDVASMKLLITIEGQESGGDGLSHTQVCEMLVVRRVGATVNIVDSVVYGVLHTSLAPLATLTAQLNVNGRVEILAQPTNTTAIYVKVHATEVVRGD